MIAPLLLLVFALAQVPPVPATPAAAPTGPMVVLETSYGPIKIVLNKEKAPISVDNFLKYVRARHYDGTIFHRVIPGFMIQGGGFTADLKEKPTRPAIRNEAKNGLRNSRGTIAMARVNDPDSATSQFFISVRDNHRLDYAIGGAGYAVFGEVVEGMDVVDKIVAVPTITRGAMENVPLSAITIKTVREVVATVPATPKPAPPVAPAETKP